MFTCDTVCCGLHIYFFWIIEHFYVFGLLISALQSLWGKGDYKEEMDEMLAEQVAIESAPPKSPLELLRDRTVRWQLMTMSFIQCCNQLSGITMVRMETFYFVLGLIKIFKVKPICFSFPAQYLLFWHLPGGRYTERPDPLRHSWSWSIWNNHNHFLCE